MIPTFNGRLQTRVFLVLFVALPWTLIVTPFLPGHRGDAEGSVAADLYPVTIASLAIVLVLGLVLWEPIYYLFQIMRWEKDWPVMFFLLELIPEAILTWYVLKWIGPSSDVATLSTFLWHIIPTWLLMWFFVMGPIKVVLIRWRTNGGRIFF